jgi:hypothetical protein
MMKKQIIPACRHCSVNHELVAIHRGDEKYIIPNRGCLSCRDILKLSGEIMQRPRERSHASRAM